MHPKKNATVVPYYLSKYAYMNKIHIIFGSVFAAVLLAGAGCAEPPANVATPHNQNDETMGMDAMEKKEDVMKDVMEKMVTDFRLRAEALDERTVRFEWDVPENIAKEAEGYRFSRGTEKDPAVNKDGWWWERGPAHRELEWQGLPIGPAHFRVCVVKNDACDVYSNDVEVDVQ